MTRPGLAFAIAIAAFALPTIASGALSGPAAPAANSVTYQDSTGEDPAGPDITTITVSNDDTGLITFRINVPNRPRYGQDIGAFMYIDSDAKQSTGDPENLGADFIIQLIRGEIILFRWDGTDYTVSANQSTLSYSWSDGPTIRISKSDLDNTRRLSFAVIVVSGIAVDPVSGAIDCESCKRDFAPVVGFYPYEVKITPPTLVAKKLTAVPAKPAAGKPFTLRLVAARSDTGAVIQNGRVSCTAKAGNKALKAQVARVVAGAATCTWSIPASASGKAFRGSVTVSFEGLKASQSYVGKVR